MNENFHNIMSVKLTFGLVKCYRYNLGLVVAMHTHFLNLSHLVLPRKSCRAVKLKFLNKIVWNIKHDYILLILLLP